MAIHQSLLMGLNTQVLKYSKSLNFSAYDFKNKYFFKKKTEWYVILQAWGSVLEFSTHPSPIHSGE